MTAAPTVRHFLRDDDITPAEQAEILDLAVAVKADRWGRTHDVANLFIIDGSIFTTSACVNPTPTIQALALRTADYLKGEGGQVIK